MKLEPVVYDGHTSYCEIWYEVECWPDSVRINALDKTVEQVIAEAERIASEREFPGYYCLQRITTARVTQKIAETVGQNRV